MTPFSLPHIRLVRLVFSAGTVFFSHNNSAGTVFFSQFQPKFRPANGAYIFDSAFIFRHPFKSVSLVALLNFVGWT